MDSFVSPTREQSLLAGIQAMSQAAGPQNDARAVDAMACR
jgi:hypothetical protein